MPKKIDHDMIREAILEFVERYLDEYDAMPSSREVADGTGFSASTAYREMKAMTDEGILKYKGHARRPIEAVLESKTVNVPVLGYVACGPGEEEEERRLGTLPLSRDLAGNHEYYALIAKGESMVDAGISPGDYIIIQRDRQARFGDVVVALLEGMNNLKVLGKGDDNAVCYLKSKNRDKRSYPDIPVYNELRIQGVARYVIHQLNGGIE